jgi:hypothetical protein
MSAVKEFFMSRKRRQFDRVCYRMSFQGCQIRVYGLQNDKSNVFWASIKLVLHKTVQAF